MNRHLTFHDRVRRHRRPMGVTAAVLAAVVGAGALSASILREDVADATTTAAAGSAGTTAANRSAAAAAQQVTWHKSSNLVKNSKFARGSSHWHAARGTSLTVLKNKAGRHIARLTVSGGHRDAMLAYTGDSIAKTRKGQRYLATMVVRSRTPGEHAALRVREHGGNRVVGVKRTAIVANHSYQRITVDYVAQRSGSTLDLRVKANNLGRKNAVFVRSVSLVTFTRAGSGNGGGSGSRNTAREGWTLDWSDEFDGSSVNTNKWQVRDGGNLSYDLATIRKSNATVSGGVLSLHAKRGGGDGRDYTSAYLDTIRKASWTYGRFEMRAKLPLAKGSSKGLWPAFWLRPDDGRDGELDIMEAVGSDTAANHVSHTIWYDYNGTYPREVNGYDVPGGTTSWHTYAVEWEPDAIRWYVDDVKTFEQTRSETPWITRAFARPFNIRLNLQVGGSWPGSPNAATDFSQTYDIDYVRVYQRP